jgi:DNA-binding response OmpR family regulator
MNSQNVIFYQFNSFYKIMRELDVDLNLNILQVLNDDECKEKIKNLDNYVVISNTKQNFSNQLIIENYPINIFKFIEKLNLTFLKNTFNEQSKIVIKNYLLDLNSREIKLDNKNLKLTEKEVQTILYLSKSKKPSNIDELQKKVWGYHSKLETHTVETHIYRLRKKFLNTFNDQNFIMSYKHGYQIN